jgi:hypothetical protein
VANKIDKNNCIFEKKEGNILDDISSKYNAYKGKNKHHYTRWHDFYFHPIRFDNLNILEIGVAKGVSLRMWKEYFPNANVCGIEIDSLVIDKDLVKGCKIFIGDQMDHKFIEQIHNSVNFNFDIIINDGSSITSDQVKTFEFLFKKLNPGGIYVIENLQTSYQKKDKENIFFSAVNFLKKIVDDVNYNGKFKCNSFDRVIKKRRELGNYEKTVEGISFHAGICFIFKRYLK